MRKTFLAGLGLASLAVGIALRSGKDRRETEEPVTGRLPDGQPGTAVVTGASAGMGRVFARRLAAQGYDLILVARRADRLADLAAELMAQHSGLNVETLAADLAEPAGIQQVEARIAELDSLTLLVNNAGFGTSGKFYEIDLDHQLDMIRVHVIAPVRFSRAALPGMVERRRGAIINVASLAAFVPLPGSVTYCATKAYLVAFSEALQTEVADRNVRIQALCPGFTRTEFHGRGEYEGRNALHLPGFMWMPADKVVDASLAALRHRQVVCIPGAGNQAIATFVRNLPTSALARFTITEGSALL